MLPRTRAVPLVAALASVATLAPASVVGAQLIPIKTLPIAEGDQFRLFPSANMAMGGLAIAVPDTLLDPFVNPAKGARSLRASSTRIGGSPTFYSLSRDAGGGQTLPLTALGRRGATFGGIGIAIQEIDRIVESPAPLPIAVFAADGTPFTVATDRPSRQNRYAFAMAGREFASRGVSVGGSLLYSSLSDVDGTELLYAGSQRIRQHGGALDLRLGVLKQWTDGQSLEALVLHHRYGVTHDVTWLDPVWDPNVRGVQMRARDERNRDLTNTWGVHLNYVRPLADSAWRVGVVATTNLMSHPHLPEYQIERVNVIPWDPGYSDAHDLGVGVAKVTGTTTFGVDAVFEPIRSHTWGEAQSPIPKEAGGVVPVGGRTTENWFRFRNAVLRAGVGQDLPIDTATGSRVRLQLGIALRSINYALRQLDHVTDRTRRQRESWTEWTRTWGVGLHLSGVELRYAGLLTTGTGRPGIESDLPVPTFDALSAGGRNILSAPSGPLTLTGVSTTTHQISVAIPMK